MEGEISPIENQTKDLMFYTQKAIWAATFIGGPIAGGYMVRQNFVNLKKADTGSWVLAATILFTILLFVGLYFTPEAVLDKIPNIAIPFAYTLAIYIYAGHSQGKILEAHKANQNAFYSGWRVAGVTLLALLIMLVVAASVFIPVLMTDNAIYEAYDQSLEGFDENETKALQFHANMGTENNASLIKEINKVSIPMWEANLDILDKSNQIPDLPPELVKQNENLQHYCELRIAICQLFAKALREDTNAYDDEIDRLDIEIGEVLGALNASVD